MSNAYNAGYTIGMLMEIAFIVISLVLAITGVNSTKTYIKVLSWIQIVISIIFILLLFIAMAAK